MPTNTCSNCGCSEDYCDCCSHCGDSDCGWCDDCDSPDCQCSCSSDECYDDHDSNVNRYSWDPIQGLAFNSFQPNRGEIRAPRYGLEIELSGYEKDELYSFNRAYHQVLQAHPRLFTASDGYATPCSDGSITGSSPAELKTPPYTKWEHYAAHLASMMPSVERERFDWAALYRQPWKYKCRLMQSFVDARHTSSFMPSANAWSNSSCGLHVNVDYHMMASRLTWAKVLWFVHHLQSEHLRDFGGRYSCGYAQQVHYQRFGHIRSALCRHQYHDSRPGFQKYEVINISKPHIYEVRLFRSTVNPMRLLANLELLEVLCDFMRQLSVSQAKRANTAHLGHYLSLRRSQYPFAHSWMKRSRTTNSLRYGAEVSKPLPLLTLV